MYDLLICDNEKELRWLLKQCGENYIIATLNYEFYRSCEKENKKVIFWESDAAMPRKRTWDIINRINNIIREIGGIKKTLIYEIPYHIEGGQFLPTTIAFLILNLDLIDRYVQKYQICSFFTVDNKTNWAINESIFLYSRGKNLKCVILDEIGGIKSCLFTLRDTVYNPDKRKQNEELRKNELESIKDKYKRQGNIQTGQEKALIGILYCAKNSPKHMTWTKQHISICGEKVRVIAFYHSEDIEEFRRSGIAVDCLEDYFRKEVFRKSYLEFVHDRKIILSELKRRLQISYEGIDISIFLNRKIENYFYRYLVEFVYVDCCAKEYFRLHKYDLIRTWGNSNFWQTQICYENIQDSGTELFCICDNDVIANELYEPNQDIISFFLCANSYIKKDYVNKKYCGQAYITFDVRHGKNFYGKDKILINPKKKDNYLIAILPSTVEPGFNTVRTYYNHFFYIVNHLLGLNCKVTFKNHGRINEYLDKEIKDRFKGEKNIIFVDKEKGCYDILKECDLVITDISTIIYDAACEQKPVLCIVDEQEFQLIKPLEEGFQIYRSAEELCRDVEAMISGKYQIGKIMEKQNRYMKKILGCYDENDEKTVIKLLDDRIRRKGIKTGN